MGTILCYLMDACDRIRDYDRAVQWCDRVREWAGRYMPEIYAICRPHYAVVLMWRGEWMRAESELETAMSDLATFAAPMITESVVRLAELRTQQGRFDEAQALFRRVEGEALALAPRAELALALGQYEDAASLAERHLRRLPVADRIDRATGLELAVRAYAALGRMDDARAALAELDEVAAATRACPVRAAASFASGVFALAEARLGDAVRSLEDAVDEYAAASAPFQTGRARVALADALYRLGRRDAAAREANAARDALAALGAVHEAARAADVLACISTGDALPPSGAQSHELTAREVDVLRLIADGRSNQQIAEALVLSPRTVERHISNIYLKLGLSGAAARAAAAAYALKSGLTTPS